MGKLTLNNRFYMLLFSKLAFGYWFQRTVQLSDLHCLHDRWQARGEHMWAKKFSWPPTLTGISAHARTETCELFCVDGSTSDTTLSRTQMNHPTRDCLNDGNNEEGDKLMKAEDDANRGDITLRSPRVTEWVIHLTWIWCDLTCTHEDHFPISK